MKRALIIIVVLLVAIGASVAGYYFLNPEPYDIAEDTEIEVLEVTRDTIFATVNATGRIEPKEEVMVNFEMSGTVAEVLVERGDSTNTGDVLAWLETDNLELAVRRAESELARAQAQLDQLFEDPSGEELAAARANLAQAEAQLEQLYEPALAEEIDSAQTSVESAQSDLERVLAGKKEAEVTVAAAALRKAEIDVQDAQWAYDQVSYLGQVGAMPQASRLEQATIEYQKARANYELAVKDPEQHEVISAQARLAQAEASLAQLLEDPKNSEVVAARAQIAQAEANLAKLLEDPRQSDLAAAQAGVEVAQVGLEQAEMDLAKSVLVAPIDGVVSEVNIKVGENSSFRTSDNLSTSAAVVLTDLSEYHIDVEVDEIDIGRIELGQPTLVIVDAIPGMDFEGHVVDIAPTSTESSSGIVAYEVSILLDSYDDRLLSGMSADATIETDRLEGVVTVPNRAVSIDLQNGEPVAFVEIVGEDGQSKKVEIQLGLRDETVSEVISGLEEGDQIVIRSESRREQLQRAFQNGD